MIQVPQYQARIPISGGGGYRGNIDLTQRLDENPIFQALMLIQQLKQQGQQGELSRRETEARIGQMQQPQMQGQIVTEGGKTWLVDKRTGQKIDLGIKTSPKVEELLKLMDTARKYEQPTEAETAIGESAEQELLGLRGLEEYEVPGVNRQWPIPNIPPRTGVRKKGTVGQSITEKTTPRSKLPAFGGMGAERYYGPGGPGFMPPKKVERKERPPKEKEPKTVQEFEAEVTRLGQIDIKKARAYYNKWARKWK